MPFVSVGAIVVLLNNMRLYVFCQASASGHLLLTVGVRLSYSASV
jgi:hypothetical protein